jgi:hypothetical protein
MPIEVYLKASTEEKILPSYFLLDKASILTSLLGLISVNFLNSLFGLKFA